MGIVAGAAGPAGAAGAVPANVAPLARLLAYAQSVGLERYLERPKRGVSTLALSLLWLYLAWRGTGRPHHLGQMASRCCRRCWAARRCRRRGRCTAV